MSRGSQKAVVLTCEHGGNFIPARYNPLFRRGSAVLKTHRGWDIGALRVAKALSKAWEIDLDYSRVSRLLIDLNRSLSHPRVFSEFTRDLDLVVKEQIIAQYYEPYRAQVFERIRRLIKAGYDVHHLSVHSFTPVLDGETRATDFGILYDPRRKNEVSWAKDMQARLKGSSYFQAWTIHRNQPYLGRSDGFPSFLRQMFPEKRKSSLGTYRGIELEINQKFLTTHAQIMKTSSALVRALNY